MSFVGRCRLLHEVLCWTMSLAQRRRFTHIQNVTHEIPVVNHMVAELLYEFAYANHNW